MTSTLSRFRLANLQIAFAIAAGTYAIGFMLARR
jgi:hypothetical protein